MDYDQDKVDEMVLALLSLTMFGDGPGVRAWKGQDWETIDRLHTKGYISEEGERRSQDLFEKHFARTR